MTRVIDFNDGSKITVEGVGNTEAVKFLKQISPENKLTDDEITLLASLVIEYRVVLNPQDSARAEAILDKFQRFGWMEIGEAFTKAPTFQGLMNVSKQIGATLSAMPPAKLEEAILGGLVTLKAKLTKEEYAALLARFLSTADN